jgi:hypothetical protein
MTEQRGSIFYTVAISIAGAIGLIVLIGLLQGTDFFLYRLFAPKYEAVRRDTFEQSKSYNQGMVQELQNMQFEYIRAAPEQQAALASIILHRSADYNVDKLPRELRDFIEKLREDRGRNQ